ncbi:MAG: hypothetical protein VW455_06420 [Nitrospinota bacterium]
MIWIDFVLVWYSAYRLCRSGCMGLLQMEKLALSFLMALALKSLILFFLIRLGIQPTASIQLGFGLLMLLLILFFPEKPIEQLDTGAMTGLVWVTILVAGGLFAFSMVNAWFFPITESDAIWYHIRGMSFFHEVRFDSGWVVAQLKQYPPFIPLLFAYLISFDVEFLKIFFPLLYLCLVVIFYSQILRLTENKKMACLFTLVLATTPYFWWHGVLPFLDLATAVFYSTGSLYWYFWMRNKIGESSVGVENSYALISGTLLGLAAWTRIEFLLYDLVPIFLTVLILSRREENDLKPLKLFFVSILFFPTLWFLSLMTFKLTLFSQFKMVGGVCFLLWIFGFGLAWGKWKIPESGVRIAFILAVSGCFALLFLSGKESFPVWNKLLISSYRTSTVHIFYLFTASLIVFLFFENLKELPELKKLLGCFLILFLCTHVAIFSYATPKWKTLGEFVYATFVQPGNSVNLSDTRGMMSVYPVFIFFIASLPFVKRRLADE